MKTLSKKCKYALHALYGLAEAYEQEPILISVLAERYQIPHKFLEVILWELKQRGIVDSRLGRKGGYRLVVPPSSVTIGSIIRIFDGPLAPLPCASETAYRKCDDCPEPEKCGTKLVMREVRDAMAAILDKRTLADVCETIRRLQVDADQRDSLMYYI